MTKCALCDTRAQYKLNNPGAEVQLYCVEHLPWFINKMRLPSHVELLNEPKEPVNESRKNNNKASSSSSGSSNPTEGTVSSGSSSGTSDTEGLPAAE